MVFIVFFIRVPSRSIQMYDALQKDGNGDAIHVTYPELGHGCWNEVLAEQLNELYGGFEIEMKWKGKKVLFSNGHMSSKYG